MCRVEENSETGRSDSIHNIPGQCWTVLEHHVVGAEENRRAAVEEQTSGITERPSGEQVSPCRQFFYGYLRNKR